MSEKIYLVRFFVPQQGIKIGVQKDDIIYTLNHEKATSIASLLDASIGRVDDFWDELLNSTDAQSYIASDLENPPNDNQLHGLPPVDSQDVWAAGVTYERSRSARQEEAVDGGDVYARVYSAARPELFFKAQGHRTVGHKDHVGIRQDSDWNVPEPELALVLNPAMEIVGLTIGNDMSSRSIEGENPLYLPQAKVYTASCAIGPRILRWTQPEWLAATITVQIVRDNQTVFEGSIHTDRIHRSIPELVDYLGRSSHYPEGAVLLTGTGIVPPNEFTLAAGDVINITIGQIGTLTNVVKVV